MEENILETLKAWALWADGHCPVAHEHDRGFKDDGYSHCNRGAAALYPKAMSVLNRLAAQAVAAEMDQIECRPLVDIVP